MSNCPKCGSWGYDVVQAIPIDDKKYKRLYMCKKCNHTETKVDLGVKKPMEVYKPDLWWEQLPKAVESPKSKIYEESLPKDKEQLPKGEDLNEYKSSGTGGGGFIWSKSNKDADIIITGEGGGSADAGEIHLPSDWNDSVLWDLAKQIIVEEYHAQGTERDGATIVFHLPTTTSKYKVFSNIDLENLEKCISTHNGVDFFSIKVLKQADLLSYITIAYQI